MTRIGIVLVGCILLSSCVPSVSDGRLPTTTKGVDVLPSSTSSSVTSTVATATTAVPILLESEPIDLGPLAPRGGHSVIWTGDEMIVWGGEADEIPSEVFADGAAFDPTTGSWRVLAEAPLTARRYHVAAWTGSEMLIISGVGKADGAAYQPATDTWRPISDPPIRLRAGWPLERTVGTVWTGSELVVWDVAADEVAAYDPDSDSWRVVPPTALDADSGTLRTDGESVYAFGATVGDYPATNDLSVQRLVGNEWESLPPTGFSTGQLVVGANPLYTVWTGNRFLAWSDSGAEATTMAFDPESATWARAPDVPIPGCEGQGEPIAADGIVFAFAWCRDSTAILDVATDTWSQAVLGGFPTARYTIWTGDQLITWGDTCCYGTGLPFTIDAWQYHPNN